MPTNSDNYDYTVMLDEAQKYYEVQIRSFEILRKHAETVLGIASVLISLFATFGITNILCHKFDIHTLIIIAITLFYGFLIAKSLATVLPGLIQYPIAPTAKSYAKAFLNKNKLNIIKQKLSDYLSVIIENEKILRERRKSGKLITILLAINIMLILIFRLI